MIYVRLMGGLGNQMFQYAVGRELAVTRGVGLVLDKSHYLNQPKDEVPRTYELDCFDLPAKQTEKAIETVGERPTLEQKFSRKPVLIQEKAFNFDPEVIKAPKNCLLVGYWQSEKYFINHAAQIRQDFTFIKQLSPTRNELSKQIAQTANSVGLQVRRSDFANHVISSQFHGLVPMDYYQKAVTYLAGKLESPTFFVVSDDSQWCRQNLKLGHPTVFVDHVPDTGHEDMNLLSQCQHQIIANSSFGWWAAWLNKYEQKVIIAPKNWFKADNVNTADLLPETWVKLG